MFTLLGAFVLVLGLSTALPSCEDELSPDRWLEAARQANLLADDLLQAGEIEHAVAALTEVIQAPRPGGMADEDRRAVIQDIAFRLAEIEMGRERPQPALQWADLGLSLGLADDLFTANLYVARGCALEQLGQDQQAAEAYLEALRINEVLLQQSLRPLEDP